MPRYQVSFRQAHDNTFPTRRKWSNVLFLDAASSIAAAAAGVGVWLETLRNAQHNTIFCYEVYATDMDPATDDYTVQSVPPGQQRGTLALTGGERYLPKVCMAVTLSVPGSRPSRKFWRVDLYEGDINEGRILNPALVTAATTAFNTLVADDPGFWKDVDGQAITGVRKVTLTTREFGRESTVDVPEPPPVG